MMLRFPVRAGAVPWPWPGLFFASLALAGAPAAQAGYDALPLTEIATEKNSTIVFPLPIDLIKVFLPADAAKRLESTTTTPGS